jgi:hypothetical protein
MDVTLRYTEPLVRSAVRRFCVRTIGWLYPAAVLAVAVSLAVMLRHGDQSWLVGAIATFLLLAVVVPILLYRIQLSGALARFRALEGGSASFRASDLTVTIRSAGGMAEFPWRTITAVWRYDDCMLLLIGGHFITFPLVGVSSDARDYVIARVIAHGGTAS